MQKNESFWSSFDNDMEENGESTDTILLEYEDEEKIDFLEKKKIKTSD